MNEIKRRKKETQYLVWLAKIISKEVTNSTIGNPTVVDCRLSNDGAHLKVYVSFTRRERRALAALQAARGFIRTQLSHYDSGRRVPELDFNLDQVAKTAARIDQLLQQVQIQTSKKEPNDDD